MSTRYFAELALLTMTAVCSAQPPPDVDDLPLTEIWSDPDTPEEFEAKGLAIMISGDGGWAGLDQETGALLADKGMPVVGISTLKYFWKERTPDEAAADIARVGEHYLARWKRTEIHLVGYSFGGEVMPFIANRLPPDLRKRVRSMTLIAPGPFASFEVHVANWVPGNDKVDGPSVIAEFDRMAPLPTLCLSGSGDDNAICPRLAVHQSVRSEVIGDGHHLGNEYDKIAGAILSFAKANR